MSSKDMTGKEKLILSHPLFGSTLVIMYYLSTSGYGYSKEAL